MDAYTEQNRTERNDQRLGDLTFHSLNGSSVATYLILNIDDVQYKTDICV